MDFKSYVKMVQGMYGKKLIYQAMAGLMAMGILSFLGLIKMFEIIGGWL